MPGFIKVNLNRKLIFKGIQNYIHGMDSDKGIEAEMTVLHLWIFRNTKAGEIAMLKPYMDKWFRKE